MNYQNKKTNVSNMILLISFLIFSFSLNSLSSSEIYGHLNLSADFNVAKFKTNKSSFESNASRLGIKGNFEINDKITGIYQVEFEFDTEDISTRNTFLGLKGDFGSFTLGKQDTPLKLAQLNADLFNDLRGDIKFITRGENRISLLGYESPELAEGLTLNIGVSNSSYAKQNTYEVDFNGVTYDVEVLSSSHISTALPTSVTGFASAVAIVNNPFGFNDPCIGLGLSSSTGLFAAPVGQSVFPVGTTFPTTIVCSESVEESIGRNISFSLNYKTDVINLALASQIRAKEGFDHNRLGMVIPAGKSTFGIIYTTTKSSKSTYSAGGNNIDYEAYTLSFKRKFLDGKGSLKLQYDSRKGKALISPMSAEQFQIGYDHNLNDDFKIFTYLNEFEGSSYFSIGIEYKFRHSIF